MNQPVSPEIPAVVKGYRILDLIGRGAMGAVYRATAGVERRGLRRGEEVALKVLEERFSLDPMAVRRFKREAGVGLGAAHPGLARVHEVGSVGIGSGRRLYFIAQELLTGRSLRAILDEGRLGENLVRQTALQMAEALCFVHRKGIIHRDLKPANVFMEVDGRVKLVDFGLAGLARGISHDSSGSFHGAPRAPLASAFTSAGRFLGTVAYAAPEQLQGRPATPQSDLYALGLVLFEMAAGVHPFADALQGTFDSYCAAVLEQEPPALTTLQPSISWFLETVVQALLKLDRRRRIQSAAELLQILREAESGRWWKEVTSEESGLISRSRRLLKVRRLTRVEGRRRELVQLKDQARRVLGGHRGVPIWIEGEAGIGKTRLLDQLADWVEEQGISAYQLVAHCAAVEVPSPFYPLRRLVSDALGLEAARKAGGDLITERLDRYLSQRRRQRDELVRHLAGTGGFDDTSSEPLVDAYCALFEAVAEEAPTLFVVHSVHGADPQTLAVVRRLAAGSAAVPLQLLLTFRPDEQLEPGPAQKLQEVRSMCTVIQPSLLTPEQLTAILPDLAIESADLARMGRRLHQLTEGNPLFALELFKLLQERGELEVLRSKGLLPVRLPASLEGIFAESAARLDPEERQLLETAAVLGASFRPDVLREVVGMERLPFSEMLARLEQKRLLAATGTREVHFRRSSLRRYLQARIPVARRRDVHRRAALHYDREAVARGGSRAPLKAALQAELAQERPILLRHLAEACHLLNEEGRGAQAYQLAGNAQRLARMPPEDQELLLVALLERGRLAHRLGRGEEERLIWREAIRLATELRRPEERASALHGLGRLNSRSGRFVAAETQLRGALAGVRGRPEAGLPPALIRLDLAECLLWSGDEERSAEELSRAESELDLGADPFLLGRFHKERGTMLLELERFDEAREAFREARSAVRGRGFRGLHRACLIGTARLLRDLADYSRARGAAEIVIQSARADRDVRQEAIARFILGETEARSANPDAAFPQFLRAARLARQAQDGHLRANSLGSLALLYRWKRFRRHSPRRAVELAERSIALARDLTITRLEARARVALALCYGDLGQIGRALETAESALREAPEWDLKRRRAAEMHFMYAMVLKSAHRRRPAQRELEKARIILSRRLEGLAQPADRERMQRGDPLHRQVERARI